MHPDDAPVPPAAQAPEALLAWLGGDRAILDEVLRQMQRGVIIAAAPAGRLLLGNDQADHLWGRPWTTFPTLAEYVAGRGAHPDGRPYTPEEWPLMRAITTGEQVTGEEIAVLRGDGTPGLLSVSAAPIRDPAGHLLAGVMTFYDLTAQRQAGDLAGGTARREEQAQLLDLAHDTIFSHTPEGVITFWNRGAVLTYGWDQAAALGRNVHDLLQTEFPQPLAEIEATLRREGQWEGELVHRRRDSSRVIVASRWSLQSDAAGQPRQVLEINKDITLRKRAEAQLVGYTRRLQTLRELDQAILTTRPPEAVARIALGYIRQLVPCQGAEVVIFDRLARQAFVLALDCETGTGDDPSPAVPSRPLPLDEAALPAAFREGRPYLGMTASERGGVPTLGPHQGPARPAAVMSIPLRADGELLGALNIWAAPDGEFGPPQVEIAGEVANQLAIAIQNGRLFARVQDSQARLQQLSRRLLDAQEQERRRLARELHDEIGQVLTAVQINIEALRRLPVTPSITDRLQESIDLVGRALQQVRDLSLDLRPSLLDDLGLERALNWYVTRQAQRTGLEITLALTVPPARLPEYLETACFRIAQEALTNVARHAAARRVMVALRYQEGWVELIVRDDGSGFDPPTVRARAVQGASLGLLSMEERAELAGGTLTISAAPGQGTTVRARFPYAGGTA
jgi:PAS domain S-box-containing protein